MPNSLSALNREFWANECQRSLFVENSAVFIANTALRNLAAGDGDTVNKPAISYPDSNTYTPGSDLSDKTLSASNEQLSIATWLASSVVVDDTERIQNYYSAGQIAAQRMMKNHNNKIEQAVLAEITNAQHTVDASTLVGGATGNILVTTDNANQIFTGANTKLNNVDAPMGNRVAVIGGHTMEMLQLTTAGRQTNFGDQVLANGYIGKLFNWDIVYNNNLPFTAVLSLVTQPSNGDTLTIAGVTITLHATLIASAWADIRTNVDTTRSFIRDLINYGNGTGGTVAGTVGTDFTDVSAENRFLWQKRGLLAVNDDTADTLTVTGYGDITVAETLTDATDTWTSAQQDSWFGVKGATDLIVQIPPKIEVVRVEKQFAERVKSLLGYGKKTYADGAREMVRVKINALGSVAGSNWN